MRRQHVLLSAEARIAQLRLAGLLRMIAAAENRALKLEVEKDSAAAAPARERVERYRRELALIEALASGGAADGDAETGNRPTAEEDRGRVLDLAHAQQLRDRTVAAEELAAQRSAELEQVSQRLVQAETEVALLQARISPEPRPAEAPPQALELEQSDASLLPAVLTAVPEMAAPATVPLQEIRRRAAKAAAIGGTAPLLELRPLLTEAEVTDAAA